VTTWPYICQAEKNLTVINYIMVIEKRVFHMYWLDRTTTTVMQQLSCFLSG